MSDARVVYVLGSGSVGMALAACLVSEGRQPSPYGPGTLKHPSRLSRCPCITAQTACRCLLKLSAFPG